MTPLARLCTVAFIIASALMTLTNAFNPLMTQRHGALRVRPVCASNRGVSSVVAAVLLLQSIAQPTIALDDFDAAPTPAQKNEFEFAYSANEEARVAKKIKLLQEAEGRRVSEESTADGDRYKASLAKEKAKVNAISSKSKAQRARDLCESLGRGC